MATTVSMPENYEQWKHCITVISRLPLTEEYIRHRIDALCDMNDHMTARFVELYGEDCRVQTLEWFQRALQEVSGSSR